MGTGKTETAKVLARELGRSFVDMDEAIEQKEHMLISDIFSTKGEAYFRQVEKDVLNEISGKKDCVVACGGGSFTFQENIDVLKKSGIVICLTSSAETILRRTQKFTHRPLLNVRDPKKAIEELLKKRSAFYAQAHYTIDADQLTVEQAAEEILKILNSSNEINPKS